MKIKYLIEFKCKDMIQEDDKLFDKLSKAVKFISDIHDSTILEYWLLYKTSSDDSDSNLIGDNISGLYLSIGDQNND